MNISVLSRKRRVVVCVGIAAGAADVGGEAEGARGGRRDGDQIVRRFAGFWKQVDAVVGALVPDEAGEDVVLVNPSEIIACMKKVPCGKVVTIVEICKHIAKQHHVQGCCSLTTGIFIMTAANAVEEARKDGVDMGIPYWRTLKSDGYLNEKFPGGDQAHKALLEKEGFKVVAAGQRWRVENFQAFLADGL